MPITIAPLRGGASLPTLIEHFLSTSAAACAGWPRRWRPRRIARCSHTIGPGNVREARHALEQAVVLAPNGEIQREDLPAALHDTVASAPAAQAVPTSDAAGAGFKESKQRVVEQFERRFIADALTRHRGNISKAAEEMGMYRQHLQLKLAEYGIDAGTFKK